MTINYEYAILSVRRFIVTTTKDVFIVLSWTILIVVLGVLAGVLPNFQNSFGIWCATHQTALLVMFFAVFITGMVQSSKG